jgi:hypothetical protein
MIQHTIFSFKTETTKDRLTAHAGLALMAEFNHWIGLRQFADWYLPVSGSNRGFNPSDKKGALSILRDVIGYIRIQKCRSVSGTIPLSRHFMAREMV